MSRRTIRVFAVLNVLAAALLFVWFRTIPAPSQLEPNMERALETAVDVDADFRLEMTTRFRDAWRRRAWQYRWFATAAGAVVLLNAGVFAWHLLLIKSRHEKRVSVSS